MPKIVSFTIRALGPEMRWRPEITSGTLDLDSRNMATDHDELPPPDEVMQEVKDFTPGQEEGNPWDIPVGEFFYRIEFTLN